MDPKLISCAVGTNSKEKKKTDVKNKTRILIEAIDEFFLQVSPNATVKATTESTKSVTALKVAPNATDEVTLEPTGESVEIMKAIVDLVSAVQGKQNVSTEGLAAHGIFRECLFNLLRQSMSKEKCRNRESITDELIAQSDVGEEEIREIVRDMTFLESEYDNFKMSLSRNIGRSLIFEIAKSLNEGGKISSGGILKENALSIFFARDKIRQLASQFSDTWDLMHMIKNKLNRSIYFCYFGGDPKFQRCAYDQCQKHSETASGFKKMKPLECNFWYAF